MADNTTITPGRGTKIATDEIEGVHYQRIKPVIGPDGEAVDLEFGQKAKAESLPVTVASDDIVSTNQVTAAYDVAVTVTRPANQTPYSAKDVVGGVISFPNVGPSGATIMITRAELGIYISALPTGMTSFRFHLYNMTPPSAFVDNEAWSLPSGDRASYLGFIDIYTPENLGSTLYAETENLAKQVKLAGTGLWAYLVTTGAYTPAANSEVYKPSLHTQAV